MKYITLLLFMSALSTGCMQIPLVQKTDIEKSLDSCLKEAILANDYKQVKKMLESNIGVNSNDAYKRTPLVYAIQQANLDMIKLLISQGALVNTQDVFEKDLLSHAILKGDESIIKYLIEEQNLKPITEHLAIVSGLSSTQFSKDKLFGLFLYLISKGINIEIDNDNLKAKVMHGGHIQIVDYFISRGMRFGSADLYYALRPNHTDMIKSLLEKKVIDLSPVIELGVYYSPLDNAIEMSSPKMIELFIQYGCDVNTPDKKGKYPITTAFNSRNIEKVNTLIQHGAQWKNLDFSPWAFMNYPLKDWDTLKALGISWNYVDKNGQNLFHVIAVIGKDPERVEKFNYLLREVDSKRINDIDFISDGTPLLNSTTGDSVLINLFIQNGANINQPYWNGLTPLMLLVQKKAIAEIELLLRKNVDIDAKDQAGNTAYDYALKLPESSEKMRILLILKNKD